MTAPSISFEYFPPKTEAAEKQLWEAAPKLAALDPLFMTVTYGAGGSTKDGTIAALKRMIERFDIPMASHLTFLTTTRADLDAYIDTLWETGVRHIVALRGDLPDGKSFEDFRGENYYDVTSNFVMDILKRHPFEISVAAYPEKHPDAPSLQADIEALRLKCEAGAERAITQFFFDNEDYFRFMEQCASAGITTPICPGLLPIHDFKSMVRFAGKCEANVPDWLHEKFDGLEDKPEEARKIATDLLVAQTRELAEAGVPHIHFYTLNKFDITAEACMAIGYKSRAA